MAEKLTLAQMREQARQAHKATHGSSVDGDFTIVANKNSRQKHKEAIQKVSKKNDKKEIEENDEILEDEATEVRVKPDNCRMEKCEYVKKMNKAILKSYEV